MYRLRYNSKVIIAERWTVLLDRSRARQSRITKATVDCIQHQRLTSRRYNRWGWHNETRTIEKPSWSSFRAAFLCIWLRPRLKTMLAKLRLNRYKTVNAY